MLQFTQNSTFHCLFLNIAKLFLIRNLSPELIFLAFKVLWLGRTDNLDYGVDFRLFVSLVSNDSEQPFFTALDLKLQKAEVSIIP